jgi:hypothetical protein
MRTWPISSRKMICRIHGARVAGGAKLLHQRRRHIEPARPRHARHQRHAHERIVRRLRRHLPQAVVRREAADWIDDCTDAGGRATQGAVAEARAAGQGWPVCGFAVVALGTRLNSMCSPPPWGSPLRGRACGASKFAPGKFVRQRMDRRRAPANGETSTGLAGRPGSATGSTGVALSRFGNRPASQSALSAAVAAHLAWGSRTRRQVVCAGEQIG